MSEVLRFTMAAYRNMLRMSPKKRLLVEGPTDRRAFRMLFQGLGVSKASVDIDIADLIDHKEGSIGNGEKVEAVCRSISTQSFSNRLVGFVDREYREFGLGPGLSDSLGRHAVNGRIVWSRGHSVENYFFSTEILREPLRTFSVTDFFDSALDLFDAVVLQAIAIACAIGLSGWENESLSAVRGSLRWELFRFSEGAFSFDHVGWARVLANQIRMKPKSVDSLTGSFLKWSAVTRESDPEVVRWLCDGHVGMSAMWAVYGACVAAACTESGMTDVQREVSRVLKADESVRFNACAESWARRAIGDGVVFPVEVPKLLGLL